eukprot:339744_1
MSTFMFVLIISYLTFQQCKSDCLGLDETDCLNQISREGDPMCAYNTKMGDCYAIARRQGEYGNGNYDDGYITAEQQMQTESEQLETIVYIFVTIVILLTMSACVAGICYVYRKGEPKSVHKKLNDREIAIGNNITIGNNIQTVTGEMLR